VSYGARFFNRRGWIPFSLTYQHRTLDDDSDFGNEVEDEVIFLGEYRIREKSGGSLEYDLSFEEIQDESARRQRFNVTNLSYFGERGEKRLHTRLRFTERKRFRQLYTTSGSTNLEWQHTANLSSQYFLDARWYEGDLQSLTSLNPRFLITHHLYESLTTEVEIHSQLEDNNAASRYEFGGRMTEDYRKWLGEWGRLSISVTPRALMVYTRPDQDSAFAIDESHVMRQGERTTLRRRGVIASTIVVRSSTGFVYDQPPADDYTVIQVGGSFETQLELTLGSSIADGETVLVTYEYELQGRSDVLTFGVDVVTNLSLFDHLRLIGRYETSEQNVLSGDEETARVIDFDRSVAGVEIRWPWFTATADYEYYDATIGPFHRFLGVLSLFTYGLQPWQARGSAAYGYQRYTDTGETVNRVDLSGSTQFPVFQRGRLEFEANYQRERWSGVPGEPNNREALFFGAEYSWRYRKFRLGLETEIGLLRLQSEERRVFKVDLRVSRSF
jgi:hypothetical protein